MTWYAHHIFAQANQPVLDLFLHHPVLSRGVYWVHDLDAHAWYTPEIQHALPPEGLIVVRPVGDPAADPALLSWHQIGSDTDIALDILSILLGADNRNIGPHETPPLPFLAYLKQTSQTSQTVVAYYYCEMWAGEVGVEYSYVYTPDETAYANKLRPTTPQSLYRYRPNASHEDYVADVVIETLNHFDLVLPTPYFAINTRSFPWERYRVIPND